MWIKRVCSDEQAVAFLFVLTADTDCIHLHSVCRRYGQHTALYPTVSRALVPQALVEGEIQEVGREKP